ncbi:MAG: trigger factor [Clostridiaceae bacterium]
MKTKMEKIETNVVELEITVEKEKFEEALKKSFKENRNKFNIPGFRKGKATFNMVVMNYGVEVLYEDAMNICYKDTYGDALDETGIFPVDYPEVDIVNIKRGEEFVYKAKVTVKPEAELGDYKGVEVKKAEYKTSDEDVLNELKTMQDKNSRMETKEDGVVEDKDIAVIDFKGYVDGVAFEGGEGKDFSLEIGSKSFVGDFEEQLIGMKVGESKDVNVTFPEDYGKEELNGKEALFEVIVNDIKFKELTELDDEFAKEVSEFDTLEELKADIKAKMDKANTERENREYEDGVIAQVAENANVEIPDVMVEKEIDYMIKNFESRLSQQGLDLKTYYQYTNTTEENMRDMMKDGSTQKVKQDLVIEKIAEVEKVEATEEELLAKATEVAKQYSTEDIDKTVKLLLEAQKELLKTDIINEKVIKLLVDNSKAV